ncbi:MAG: glycerophosphodiester phosphodiesterase [Polyangiaceae bacterium]
MSRIASWRRSSGSRPLILGHRGVRPVIARHGNIEHADPRGLLPPENTLPAFERALAEGADGIELDVRRCATGEVVVMHDADLARMTNERDLRAIADVTWPELSRIDLGGATAPLLSDVLAWARGAGLRVNIELKHDDPDHLGLAREVAKILDRQPNPTSWLIASSFHPRLLLLLRVMFPQIATAWLIHEGQQKNKPWFWARFAPFDAVHAEHSIMPKTIASCLDSRMVAAWTVNDISIAKSLSHAGSDVLITDVPALLREALEA